VGHKVGLVRGPPSSGKTSLGILSDSASKQGFQVHLLTLLGWISRQPIEKYLQERGLPPSATWASLKNTIIIIDEAQLLYSLGADHPFWRQIKRIRQEDGGCCVLFLGMYGESRDGYLTSTPITFPLVLGLETLRLTREEFDEFFAMYSTTEKGKVLALSKGNTLPKQRSFLYFSSLILHFISFSK